MTKSCLFPEVVPKKKKDNDMGLAKKVSKDLDGGLDKFDLGPRGKG